jgi:Pyoverdine/dityrosine biosynthesis protein
LTDQTTIERAWATTKMPGPFDLVRAETYHPTYGCTFRNITLQHGSQGLRKRPADLSLETIAKMLESLVRDEGGGRAEGPYLDPLSHATATVSEEIVTDVLAQYEKHVAFGEHTEKILEDAGLPTEDDKVAAILANPHLGNKRNADLATIQEIKRGMQSARALAAPLVFVLPAFPFKDQNLFRTDIPATVPDMGEVTMLIHLHCLALAINQLSRHDVLWLVVSDGTVYEDMFGVERGSASQYVSALRDWRTRLNIGGSIHFIDQHELIERHEATFAGTPEMSFRNTEQRILDIIRNAVKAGDDPSEEPIIRAITELAAGMLWNRSWKAAAEKYDRRTLWDVHVASCCKDHLPVEHHEAAGHLWDLAIETASRYAAFNLAARCTGLISNLLPNAIRATSHAKSGQVGIPHDIGVAPWNGLGICSRETNGLFRVKSMPLCQINNSDLVRFALNTGSFGFGFATMAAIKYYT